MKDIYLNSSFCIRKIRKKRIVQISPLDNYFLCKVMLRNSYLKDNYKNYKGNLLHERTKICILTDKI